MGLAVFGALGLGRKRSRGRSLSEPMYTLSSALKELATTPSATLTEKYYTWTSNEEKRHATRDLPLG